MICNGKRKGHKEKKNDGGKGHPRLGTDDQTVGGWLWEALGTGPEAAVRLLWAPTAIAEGIAMTVRLGVWGRSHKGNA